MRLLVVIVTALMVTSWVILAGFLLGEFQIKGIELTLPKSTSDFSTSTGILNGLFSSFAVLLALIAVLLQGRELRASNIAQNEQAISLRMQVEQQSEAVKAQLLNAEMVADQLKQQLVANEVLVLQAQQQYHSSEVSRMEQMLEKLDGDFGKAELYKNALKKKKVHIAHLKKIEAEFERIGSKK